MKIKNILPAAAIAMLPVVAGAATLVVPAAGTGAGAGNSQWQSEVTLHSSAPRVVSVTMRYHQGTSVSEAKTITLQPRQTLSIADIVKNQFGVASGSGALTIDVADRDAKALAVTSRTFNASNAGEFGQDIPAVDVANASKPGDILTLAAPSTASTTRFNFGAYSIVASSVKWELLRADGTSAATRTVNYAAGEHVQYNGGIESFFNASAQNNDTVYARVQTGTVVAYGSAINNASGDPSFVPAIRTREDILIQFVGIDLDENGTVDVADADHDGVLDTPIDVFTSMFPNYFRVVAAGEFGETVTLTLVTSEASVDLLDANGTVRVTAFGDLKNTNGSIVLRGTADGSETLLTIPVRFK